MITDLGIIQEKIEIKAMKVLEKIILNFTIVGTSAMMMKEIILKIK